MNTQTSLTRILFFASRNASEHGSSLASDEDNITPKNDETTRETQSTTTTFKHVDDVEIPSFDQLDGPLNRQDTRF
jgi:hypothetical protein